MASARRIKELEQSINEDLSQANLPQIKIDGFKLPDQSLEVTFERETVTGVNRDRMWEIINSHYKKLMGQLELIDN